MTCDNKGFDTFDHSPRFCPNCNLGGARVGTSGVWDSPYIILGEGPGVQELKRRAPFVGPSGELIRESWPKSLEGQEEGIFPKVEDCFIVNATQCYVAGSTKTPEKIMKAVSICKNRLFELIGSAPRKLILAFGKAANAAIYDDPDFAIMSRRGELNEIDHPGRPGEKVWVMSILHPAFLLRGQGNINHFRRDIRAAFEQVLGITNSVYTVPKHVQLATPESIRALRKYIVDLAAERGKPVDVSADIETTGFLWHTDVQLCNGLYIDDDKNYGWIIDWDRIRKERLAYAKWIPKKTYKDLSCVHRKKNPYFWALKSLLELPPEIVQWCWHNGKFDVKFLRADGIEARVDEDTFLMSYSLDERQGGHDLETLAKNLIGAPDYKRVLDQYLLRKTDNYSVIPKPVLWHYLAQDVKNTAGIQEVLYSKVQKVPALHRLYRHSLIPASEMLTQVEMYGIQVDLAFVNENNVAYNKELEEIQQEASNLAGYWFNPNSPQQVQRLLYDELKLLYKGKRPPDTSKEMLDKLFELYPDVKVLKTIRKYRRTVKMLGTYITAVYKHLAPDGRIHTTFNLGKTTTGRLASSDPNIQNVPREARIRRQYCASLGRILVEGDYNTAELRCLAAYSKDEFLTGVFLDDTRNLHDEVSIKMYGPNFTPDQRIRAKAINFGIPYGREAFSIAEEFEISREEAQRLIDSWFEQAPGAAAFIEKCRRAPANGQTLTTVFGRKRRPGVVAPELLKKTQNEFANFFHQSTISDFTLLSACRMLPELKAINAHIVNLVHDSIITECDPKDKDLVRAIMAKHMEGVPKEFIKTDIIFSVDFKYGTHWGLLSKWDK